MITQPILHPVLFFRAIPRMHPRHIAAASKIFSEVVGQDQYHAREFIKKGDVVIDAGANLGIFSVFAESLGATVFAFEPRKKVYDLLKRRVKNAINKGLGDEVKETVPLYTPKDLGGASFDQLVQAHGTEQSTITTIDSLSLSRVDFIKMDTEGYEAQILRGAAETIKKHKPVIAMSAYHHAEDKTELPRLLKSICPEYTCELSSRGEEDFICHVSGRSQHSEH